MVYGDRRLKRGKSIRHPEKANLKLVRKKVSMYLIYIFTFLIIYTIFFSFVFKIEYIKIVGNDSINTQEIEDIIWEATDKNIFLFFDRNNYWLLSTDYLLDNVKKQFAFEDITITKKFPDTISLHVIERMGRLVWKTGPDYYVVDAYGVITRRLTEMRLVSSGDIPVMVNKAETEVLVGDTILTESMITSILEAYSYYNEYIDRDNIKFDRFEIDETEAGFYKIITRDGLEIHMNDQSSAVTQLSKLKRVVDTQNISIHNLSYINLRVENQVIYK
ncbi:FtsQ-type POTRA domain-containing protein [Patescibacteria group bacterium]|nr:FtsQ-type POTRA domain-containing protein [Patescibacteria group bacterium]